MTFVIKPDSLNESWVCAWHLVNMLLVAVSTVVCKGGGRWQADVAASGMMGAVEQEDFHRPVPSLCVNLAKSHHLSELISASFKTVVLKKMYK